MNSGMRTLALVLLVACGSASETIDAERQGIGSCGVDGHVIAGPAIGDRYRACDDEIQAVVISNGVTSWVIDGACWSCSVDQLTGPTLPLVIQFRNANGVTVCPSLDVVP